MCNAWNHPKNCSCGWGGDGHSGRSINSLSGAEAHSGRFISLKNTYDSYVNPNASCPVCGTAVFFYQSARVAESSSSSWARPGRNIPAPTIPADQGKSLLLRGLQVSQPPIAWQRAGWQPFIIESVTGIDKDYLKLTGVSQGQHLSLYLRRIVAHHQHHQVLSEHNLAQIKALADSHFQLSILLPQGSPITLNVYSLLAQARGGRSTPADSAKPTTSDDRTSSSVKPSSPRRHTVQREPKKKTERPPTSTTMTLAFRKAQERQGHS